MMTFEKVFKLTPDERRIAIALLSGWQFLRHAIDKKTERTWAVFQRGENGPIGSLETNSLPDYLKDLNAMHEAETFLTEPQWKDYIAHLGGRDISRAGGKRLLHATAAERADAFLQTLG